MNRIVRLALLVSFALGCYAQNTLVYNPFTRKLDYTGSGGGGSGTVSNCATVGSLGYYSASGTTITCVGADYIFNTHTLTLAATAIFDAAANSAQVKVVTKSQADNSTNAASTAYVDTGLATKVAKFFGTAAPGSVAGNLPGDIYSDTTNHVLYWCNAPSATAAPACTSVTSGGWTAVNGSFASSVDATKFGAVCDGSTDDTAAFTAMSALAVNIYIPAAKTCSILNPTWSSHTHIWGGPNSGLIRGAGTTGSYMLTASSKTDVGLHNLIIDGNSVTQTTANLYYVFLTGTSNWVVENCTFQNTGSPPASMGGITEFNGSGVIRSNTFKSTILGQQINVDSNSTATNRVQILNNSLNGSTTGGIWVQNSGSEGVCPVEVAGNLISSIGDSAADAGQTGNAIKVYQCDYTDVHDNTTDTTRYAGVRVTTSSWNDIHDNTIKAASETAIYCSELGGANNHCHDNHIFNSMSGINATNVSSRSPDATNKIDNNDCTNVSYYCVYGEHDVVTNNRADGVPFPFIIGHGATSHDNALKSNFCTLSSASYYPVDVCAGIDVGMVGTSTVSGNLYAGLTAITVTPVMATNTPSNIVVTAITQASPAAVTYNAGTQPANNSTVCFAQVAGMTQINGLCGTVSSSTATTFSVSINASAFSAFLATPANGTSPKAQAIEVYSSGTTPYQAFGTNVAMTNQTLAFAYLSTMANGSSVYLSDGTVGSTCAGGGTGSAAVLNNSTWNCFGGGGTPSFPLTVSGSVTSGGVFYASSTTQESVSGILNTNVLVKGGGAGGAPTNSSVTDNGTTVSTTEAISTTGSVTSGSGSGVAGSYQCAQGTAPTAGANSFGWTCPTAMTTSVLLQSPNAVPAANQIMLFPAPTSNVSQFTWTNFAFASLTDAVASAHVLGSNGSKAPVAATATDLAAINYAAGGGTAQAQTVTLSPAVTALTTGLQVWWLPVAANTAAAPTLALNGLTAKNITKWGGSGTVALVANDLLSTVAAYAIYDGTEFVLQNPQNLASTSFVAQGSTAGFADFPQGSTSAAVFPCNTATSICEQAPAAVTSYTITKPGAAPAVNNSFRLTSTAGVESFSPTIPAASDPNGGIHNFASASQSQVVVSATAYYITSSNLNMPAAYNTAIGAGTVMKWHVEMSKTAAGTGTFQIVIYKGTNGSTADTAEVTQTIGTQTGVVDDMSVEVTLVFTSATAAYWSIAPRQAAATATGFGVATGAGALFSGTLSGLTTTTASDKYGLGFIATTGTPTIVIPLVEAEAFGVN